MTRAYVFKVGSLKIDEITKAKKDWIVRELVDNDGDIGEGHGRAKKLFSPKKDSL